MKTPKLADIPFRDINQDLYGDSAGHEMARLWNDKARFAAIDSKLPMLRAPQPLRSKRQDATTKRYVRTIGLSGAVNVNLAACGCENTPLNNTERTVCPTCGGAQLTFKERFAK